MTNPARTSCDNCLKTLSKEQAVVMHVAGVTYIQCLDCILAHLDEEDGVEVSVDLLRRLKDGVLCECTRSLTQ